MSNTVFQIGVLFAIIGGCVGGLSATSKVKDGFFMSLITVVVGGLSSASVVEYLGLTSQYWVCMGVGIFVGIFLPKMILIIDVLLPEIVKGFIKRVFNMDVDINKKDEVKNENTE